VTHIPSAIVVSCQSERSQMQNKERALAILTAKLAQKNREEHQKKQEELRGQHISAEWGNQIRSYVLHPYKLVKDHRTKHETAQVEDVLDGDINDFIESYLRMNAKQDKIK